MTNRSQRLQAVARGAVNQLSGRPGVIANAVVSPGAPAETGGLDAQAHAAGPATVAPGVIGNDHGVQAISTIWLPREAGDLSTAPSLTRKD
jgi:hypothetical protein